MYVLLALGVYFLTNLLGFWIEAPPWGWRVFQMVLGIGSVILKYGVHSWYIGIAVAGGAVLLQHLDNLILSAEIRNSTHRR